MAAGTTPIFVEAVETAAVQFTSADTTALKDVVTAGADGCRVVALEAVSDDTAVINVQLYVQRDGSGTSYPIGAVQVPIGAGTVVAGAPVAAKNLLDPSKVAILLDDGAIFLGGTDKLRASCAATMTAAKTLTISAVFGDY